MNNTTILLSIIAHLQKGDYEGAEYEIGFLPKRFIRRLRSLVRTGDIDSAIMEADRLLGRG